MIDQAHVVVVDDEEIPRTLSMRLLREEKVRKVEGLDSVSALLDYLEQTDSDDAVDLILMDLQMPEMDGFEACLELKANPLYRDIPIIVLTSMKQREVLKAAFEAGADDFVVKGEEIELFARVRAALRLKFEMDERKSREQELIRITQKLLDEKEEVQKTSYIDELTGLYNPFAYPQLLKTIWRRAYTKKEGIAVALISLDFFSEYNLVHGREEGNELLQRVAQLLPKNTQSTFSARVEGGVFGIIFTEELETQARQCAEKLCEQVRKLRIHHGGSEIEDIATVTVGYTIQNPRENPSVERAEKILRQALVEGRKSGYNQFVQLHSLDETGPFRPL